MGLDGVRAAILRQRIEESFSEEALLEHFPSPIRVDQPPSLPENPDEYRSMTVEDMAVLHYRYVRYYSYLVVQANLENSKLKAVDLRLDAVIYSIRKDLRGRGLNQNEQKEEYETKDIVVDLRIERELISRTAGHLEALVKGCQRSIDMLDAHIQLRSRKPPTPTFNNPPPARSFDKPQRRAREREDDL